MFSLVMCGLMQVAPVGIDFSTFPVQKAPPGTAGFHMWITVYAANGDVLDNGRWAKFGACTRENYMYLIGDELEDNGCKVTPCGDVLVVRTLNGSPVTRVVVRVKESTGAAPALALALRTPPVKPVPVAPPPRAK
jgi:hypothetical protein